MALIDNKTAPEENNPKSFKSAGNWLKKRKVGLALVASVASIAVGSAINPSSKTLHEVEENAPWVGPVEGALDVSIAVGFSMMGAAAGAKISKNPYKNRHLIGDIIENANNTMLYRSGFAVATVAGLSWGGVAIGGIVSYLPPESWGALSYPAIDLAATVALRQVIWNGMNEARANSALELDASPRAE